MLRVRNFFAVVFVSRLNVIPLLLNKPTKAPARANGISTEFKYQNWLENWKNYEVKAKKASLLLLLT